MSAPRWLTQIDAWREEGCPIALATVAKTWGSAPRPAGAIMVVAGKAGEPSELRGFEGSVSGGCVEADVIEHALACLASCESRYLRYGVSDADAQAHGLACGGRIEIHVSPLGRSDAVENWLTAARDGLGLGRASLLGSKASDHGRYYVALPAMTGDSATSHSVRQTWTPHGSLGDSALNEGCDVAIRSLLESSGVAQVDIGGRKLLLWTQRPPDSLILVGAGHIAQSLLDFVQPLGFEPALIDPRAAFAADERFEGVHVSRAWPGQESMAELGLGPGSFVVALCHDPKIDDPSLLTALEANARYVGALGSRRSHAARCKRLLEAGASAEAIERIAAPVGLDIGALTPEEIALSIAAQLVAVRRGVP